MFSVVSNVYIFSCLVLFIRKAELAPTFTATPQSPFDVVEGNNITLVWQYNLDGSFGDVFVQFLGSSATLTIVDKHDINVDAAVPESVYQGRIQEYINATRAEITIFGLNRSESGEYEIQAVNSKRQRASDRVTVKVQYPPEIKSISSDVVVTEGDPGVTLECKAEGEPKPNITWTRVYANGSESGVLGTGNQFVLETNRNNNGTYRCTAYNGIGTAPNRTVEVDVNYKPEKFKFKGSKSTVCQGSVVTFNCSADGKPPVDTYQLLENGEPVSNGSNSLGMWSKNMPTGGEFNYTCMANNSAGTAYSMSLTVTVNVPSIVYPLENITVVEGENRTITCNASGSPVLTVTWTEVSSHSPSSGFMRYLTNISRNNGGEYKCEATNDCGNSSASTFLIVLYKPENFKFTVSESTVCQGSVVTFNCSADGKPPVDTYQLFENGVPVSNSSNSLGMWSRNMSTGGVFNYKCMANNSAGTAYSMSVTVTVNVPSSIIQITQDQNVTEGHNVTLMCNVSGIPPPMVSWMTPDSQHVTGYKLEVSSINKSQGGEYKCKASNECGNATETANIYVQYKPENVQLMSSAVDNKVCRGEFINFNCSANANPGVTSYQLFKNETAILNISASGMWSKTLENEGVFVYKCMANNSIGSEYSSSVTVTVNVPSSITPITQDQNITEGGNVTLSCQVSGVPTPTVSWIKPGGQRHNEDTLQVTHIKRSEAGEYKCEASNECGNATETATINVQYKPENVQLMSSALNNKTCKGKVISFNCSANANPGVTSYQLFENETAILNTSASGMWNKTLESEGVFVYKCVANNSLGSEDSMGVTVTVNVPSSIVQITQDQNVTEGHNVTLVCNVSGIPPPMVSWIKPDSQLVSGYKLEVTNITRSQAGEYICEASNECGNATETANIIVLHKPDNVQLTTSVTDNKACKGDMISFNCSADPSPSVTSYQLFENDTAILDANPSGMWKRNMSKGGVFMYKCMANNSLGSEVSSSVMVTVNVPSNIDAIQYQNVTEGDNLTLTCTASGMPQPKVSWIKPGGQRHNGHMLEVTHMNRTQDGKYICEASNECGNATETATIAVRYKPENVQFTTSVIDDKACQSNTITFNCSADAKPTVTSYQLFKNDTAMNVSLSGMWSETLTNGGVFVYKCVANNTVGTASSTDVIVTVNVPSNIEAIQDQNVTEGNNLTLTCTTNGMPQPKVYWIKPNGQSVAGQVLKIVNINRSEGGKYKCEASNECDNATEMATINVQYKPENVQLTTSVIDDKAFQGNTITFNCSAVAKPAVTTYQLFKNDTAMTVSLSGMWSEKLTSGGVFVYKCVANNTLGTASSTDVTVSVYGGFCGKPCTNGTSCSKFGDKHLCICPPRKKGTNCLEKEELKKNVVVELKLKGEFKQVYDNLENSETKTLVQNIKNNMMKEFNGTGLISVRVIKLRPGSIIADLELNFNNSVGESNVNALLTQAANKGKIGDMEVEEFRVGNNIPGPTTTSGPTATSQPPEDCGTFFEGEDCKKAKPGLIVLCVIGGVAVLAIIVAIIAYGLHKKKSNVASFSNGNYTARADPDGTAGSAERTLQGNNYGNVNSGYEYDKTNGQDHSTELVTFKGTNPAQTPGIAINDSSMTK